MDSYCTTGKHCSVSLAASERGTGSHNDSGAKEGNELPLLASFRNLQRDMEVILLTIPYSYSQVTGIKLSHSNKV